MLTRSPVGDWYIVLNDLKIRHKLWAILFAPLIALLVLAGVGVRQRNDTASRASRDLEVVKVVEATAALTAALNKESTYSVAAITDYSSNSRKFDTSYAAKLKDARKATDTAFTKLNDAMSSLGSSSVTDRTQQAFENVRTNLRAPSNDESYPLGTLRGTIDRASDSWSAVTSSFDGYDQQLVNFASAMINEAKAPDVLAPLQSYEPYLSYLKAESSVSNQLIGLSRQGGWLAPDDRNKPSSGLTAEDADATLLPLTNSAKGLVIAKQDFESRSTFSSGDVVLTQVLTEGGPFPLESKLQYHTEIVGIDDLPTYLTNLAVKTDASGKPVQLTAETLPLQSTRGNAEAGNELVSSVARTVEKRQSAAQPFADDLIKSLDTRHSNSLQAARLFIGFAVLVIALAVVLAVWVARSITQRINKLTLAAEKLSHEQLPRLVDSLKNPAEDDIGYLASSFTDIDVGGSDEIGNLAEAFNRIQGVAVEVATEQAQLLRKGIGDMFVNLARRNQGLLDRQIEFIDQLEAAEEDPDQLENLFRLDHLATRMRRNAESLLVLAGAEPNRRRGKPVPLADVVRAAVGEVEDFARIDMLQFDEVLVASNAALDIAHLLSELMENAANFSPPDSRVEVVGHRTKAEGYVISVADHGIGMSPEQLSESNELLSRPPLVGLALSRSLGFIVIGRLAARFGIAVRLMPSPSGGTTAMVSLPPALITDQPRSTGQSVLPQESQTAPAPEASSPTTDAPRPASAPREPAARRTPTRPTEPTSTPPAANKPLATRKPADSRPPAREAAPAQARASEPATSNGTAAEAPEDGPKLASGLTKRVPRAAGAKRAVPGGEGERSTTQNRRSPEEVRSMLSRFQSGVQRGRGDDAEPESTEETSS